MNDGLVDLYAEDLVGEGDRTDLFALHIYYFYVRH